MNTVFNLQKYRKSVDFVVRCHNLFNIMGFKYKQIGGFRHMYYFVDLV